MIIVTDKAATKIRSLVAEIPEGETQGLRIRVSSGGCSGFQYLMDISPSEEGDQTFVNGDAQVFIEEKSLPFIEGSAIDYNDGLTGAGFVIQNPKTSGTCGCGQSFSV